MSVVQIDGVTVTKIGFRHAGLMPLFIKYRIGVPMTGQVDKSKRAVSPPPYLPGNGRAEVIVTVVG